MSTYPGLGVELINGSDGLQLSPPRRHRPRVFSSSCGGSDVGKAGRQQPHIGVRGQGVLRFLRSALVPSRVPRNRSFSGTGLSIPAPVRSRASKVDVVLGSVRAGYHTSHFNWAPYVSDYNARIHGIFCLNRLFYLALL